jgi:hypothetical protein
VLKKHIQRTNSSTDPAVLNLGLAACLPPFHPPIVLNRRETSPRGPPSLQTTCFERMPLTFSESTMLLVVQRVCDRCVSPLKERAPKAILEILSERRVMPGRPCRRWLSARMKADAQETISLAHPRASDGRKRRDRNGSVWRKGKPHPKSQNLKSLRSVLRCLDDSRVVPLRGQSRG